MKHWDAEWTKDNVIMYEPPKKNHTYVCTVDVATGRGLDYSTFTIIDVSVQPFKQVATYRDSMISPLLFPDILNKYVKPYNTPLSL